MFVTQGDVGGHLSPLGGLAKDRALVMDVWPQTRFLLGSNNALTVTVPPVVISCHDCRECWAPVEKLWASIDTTDPTTGLKRGFIVVARI